MRASASIKKIVTGVNLMDISEAECDIVVRALQTYREDQLSKYEGSIRSCERVPYPSYSPEQVNAEIAFKLSNEIKRAFVDAKEIK